MATGALKPRLCHQLLFLYLLKRPAGSPLLFFCRMRDFIPPVALLELLGSAPVFIKYSYKNYFRHATLLKPSQHLLGHVMEIWILFFLNLSMPLSEMRHTLD